MTIVNMIIPCKILQWITLYSQINAHITPHYCITWLKNLSLRKVMNGDMTGIFIFFITTCFNLGAHIVLYIRGR